MNQGGNYWTLFTPGIWKVLHAVLHLNMISLVSQLPDPVVPATTTGSPRSISAWTQSTRMVVITWMYWTNLALTAGLVWRVLSH